MSGGDCPDTEKWRAYRGRYNPVERKTICYCKLCINRRWCSRCYCSSTINQSINQ